jgi:hypothetical protein
MPLDDVVKDITDMFTKQNVAAIVLYRERTEIDSKISYSATLMELVDMATTVTAVAARELSTELNLPAEEAIKMVRDAVDEKIKIMGETGTIKKVTEPPAGGHSS